MQGDEIGLRQHVVERTEFKADYFLLIRRQAVGSAIKHAHVEATGAPRRRLADTPLAANQPDCLAGDIAAQQIGRLGTRENTAAHQRGALHQPPRNGKQQRKGDVGGRIGDHRRHDRHRYAEPGRRFNIDPVGCDRLRGNGAH